MGINYYTNVYRIEDISIHEWTQCVNWCESKGLKWTVVIEGEWPTSSVSDSIIWSDWYFEKVEDYTNFALTWG